MLISLISDIDLDYLPQARNPVKKYAADKYGSEHVCSVGNWNTYKPKLAIADVLCALENTSEQSKRRRHQILAITSKLPKEFDNMSLEEALEEEGAEYLPFHELVESERQKIELAYRIVGLIKSQGRHAGGLIIANKEIGKHVPLTYRKNSKGDGHWTSEWTEGMAASQLSKFGFVKFDILGVTTLFQIWTCCQFIKKEHNIEILWERMDPIKDIAGYIRQPNGSEIPISLNDQKALGLANKVQVETIFQFDTPLGMEILRKGGVTCFNDLIIYTSLGRPGPLPLIDVYIRRRDGKESWEEDEHPKIVEILKDNYGIICFQESLGRILVEICGMTVPEAEKARKAVAKKKQDVLDKIEPRILEGFTKLIDEEYAQKYWTMIRTFGSYAFNKCASKDTLIETPEGFKEIQNLKIGNSVLTYDNGKLVESEILDIIEKEDILYEFELEDGSTIKCTKEHKFLCDDGEMHEIFEIYNEELEIVIV